MSDREDALWDVLIDAMNEVAYLRVCLAGSATGHSIIAKQFAGADGILGWAARQAAKDEENVRRQLAQSRADFPFDGMKDAKAAIAAASPTLAPKVPHGL